MAEPIGQIFIPKEDITVYELACVIRELLSSQKSIFLPDLMAQMPAQCKRHFVDHQPITAETLLYLTSSKA